MTVEEVKQLIEEEAIRTIDLKYCDLSGRWYHIAFPSRRLDYVMEHGISFDGSSIPGMKSVESGDMVIMPDLATVNIDPFALHPTLRIICNICEADTRAGVHKDPKSVADRAFAYMNETGIADEALFIPELEFHLFDEAEITNGEYSSGYNFTSRESKGCLPLDYDTSDGLSQDFRKGYHMDVPFDKFSDIREEMVQIMEDLDISVRYHHHEVGLSAQQEIETEPSAFPKIATEVFLMKDIVRQVSFENGLTSTFMPKPLFNEAGNGMHFHIQLRKDGKNKFYKEGNYADLSDEALYFIGGILKHGSSLTAFTNPSTNSFKRLLPGFEAPVQLFFGLANRSAAIRIPKYCTSEDSKRIEFRTGDATCNSYLAMSALLMAGLDGIKNKTMPTKENGYGPFDDNVHAWSQEEQARLHHIPTSLEDALAALKEDYDYLLAGDVFNEELINSFIDEKMKEVKAIKS
ncbi:MAG: type I glutamate--ammonia ligase, partial [Candidatus Cloacimonetes bacterium]|nr:type I glutamate--ammonia ligase [Candidatus Cloacimonadota bacterium]